MDDLIRDVHTGIALNDRVLVSPQVAEQSVLVARAGRYQVVNKTMHLDDGFFARVIEEIVFSKYEVPIMHVNALLREPTEPTAAVGWLGWLHFDDEGLFGTAFWCNEFLKSLSREALFDLIPVFEVGPDVRLYEVGLRPSSNESAGKS